MAANMIGVKKRIIAFDNEGEYMVMFNPVNVKRIAVALGDGFLSMNDCGKAGEPSPVTFDERLIEETAHLYERVADHRAPVSTAAAFKEVIEKK